MADGDVLQLSRSSASLLNIYSLVCSSTLIFYSSTTSLIFYASTRLLVYTYLLLAYSPLYRDQHGVGTVQVSSRVRLATLVMVFLSVVKIESKDASFSPHIRM